MKIPALIVLLAMSGPAIADGFVLGAGRWTCADALRIQKSGTPIEVGQLAGWILGYWSAATFGREDRFTDIVEQAGGEQIFKATLTECQKAPPETPVFRMVQVMIGNTK